MEPKLFRLVFLFLSGLFFGFSAAAQPVQVQGTVVDDADGRPLIGVSIWIEGTTKAVFTDLDGRYVLDASSGETLIFSYLGCDMEHRVVSGADGRQEMNVRMRESIQDLGLYVGPLGRRRSHHITAEAVYSGSSWGYGFGYLYRDFPIRHYLRNFLALGIRTTHSDPGSSRWTVNPYMQFELGMIPRGRDKYEIWLPVLPYVNAGYAFDTDFRTAEKGRFACGVGIAFNPWGYVAYTAGYNGFSGAPERNYWYLGLRIRLHKIRPILIY